jgi:hypothetical protein
MSLLFLHVDVELVRVFEIDEVEECAWNIKMPSSNVCAFLECMHTKAQMRSRNVHAFLLGRDGHQAHSTSRISSHKSMNELLMQWIYHFL